MKKIKNIILSAICLAALSSCTVITPYAVTEAPVGNKKGTSETTVILGAIHTNKNFGIAEAAKKGKITGPVSTVDLKVTNILGPLFYKKAFIITGSGE